MKITKKLLLEGQYDGITDNWIQLQKEDPFFLKQNEYNKKDNSEVYLVAMDRYDASLYGVDTGFNYVYCSKAGVNAVQKVTDWAKQNGFKIVQTPVNPPHESNDKV